MFYKNKDALKNNPSWCHQGKGAEQLAINATFAETTQPLV